MIRTKFSALPAVPVKEHTSSEILDALTNSERSSVLSIQTEIQGCLFTIKRNVYRIGQLLFNAKATLPHGQFGRWVTVTFNDDLPLSTARFYMNVYKTFEGRPDKVQMIPTEYLVMFTNSQFPDEALNLLMTHEDMIEANALQEVKQSFALYKNGAISNDEFLQITERELILNHEQHSREAKHRINRNMRHALYYGIGAMVEQIKEWCNKANRMADAYPYEPTSEQHKNCLRDINDAIVALEQLKVELSCEDRLLKLTSTIEGDKYM